MSKSVKNLLQESLQSKRLPVPKYTCKRKGGTDHQPLWLATVKLYDNREFSGEISPNKSLAEISAAKVALRYITEQSSDSSSNTDGSSSLDSLSTNTEVNSLSLSENKIAILIDLENMPRFIDGISNRLKDFTVYVFVGEHHCLVDKEFPSSVIKVISPSTRPDGSDSCMQVYAGMLLTLEKYDEYIIVTRDHYGSALIEMITCPNLGWKQKKARLVTNPSKL